MESLRTLAKVYCGKPGIVLVLFFLTCFLAQGNCELFSINPTVFEEAFGLTDTDIRLFLDYTAFSFILFSWPFLSLFKRNQNLRTWMIRFITVITFGSTLRMVPLWVNLNMGWLFHISQMIIPLGIFASALPAQVAVVWFPVEHRGFATGITSIASVLGPSVFRTIGAEITTNTSQVQEMFYVEGLTALTVFLFIVSSFPNQPEEYGTAFESYTQGSKQAAKGWLQGVLAKDKIEIHWGRGVVPMIGAIALILGLKAAVFSNMTSLLEDDDVSNTEAAWISSIQGYTQIIGATVLGLIMSNESARADRRRLLILCLFMYSILTVVFSLSFSSVFWDSNPLPYHFWLSMSIEGLAGCFYGCMRPLAFEYIAELSYPTPPGYFGAWILFVHDIIKALALLIPSSIATEFIFVIVAVAAFVSCIVIWLGTPARLDIDRFDFNEEPGYGSSVYLNKVSIVGKTSLYVINKSSMGPATEYKVRI